MKLNLRKATYDGCQSRSASKKRSRTTLGLTDFKNRRWECHARFGHDSPSVSEGGEKAMMSSCLISRTPTPKVSIRGGTEAEVGGLIQARTCLA